MATDTQGYMAGDILPTPSFFSAAILGEERNVFESSFKDGNDRNKEGVDINRSSSKMDLSAEGGVRTPFGESFSSLFAGFTSGLSPLPFELGTPGLQTPGQSALLSLKNWETARAEKPTLQLTEVPLIKQQEPSPPQSAVSPSSWRFNNTNQSTDSSPDTFVTGNDLTQTTSTKTAVISHGQVTPPSDETPCSPDFDHDDEQEAEDEDTAHPSDTRQSSEAITETPAPKRKRRGQAANAEGGPKRRRRSAQSAKAAAAADAAELASVGRGGEEVHKRSRFLERNRVAASKCRQKKKEWTSNLEVRARDLQNEKTQLAMVVNSLKDEVLWLKGELLSHANCNCERIRQYLNQEVSNLSAKPANNAYNYHSHRGTSPTASAVAVDPALATASHSCSTEMPRRGSQPTGPNATSPMTL